MSCLFLSVFQYDTSSFFFSSFIFQRLFHNGCMCLWLGLALFVGTLIYTHGLERWTRACAIGAKEGGEVRVRVRVAICVHICLLPLDIRKSLIRRNQNWSSFVSTVPQLEGGVGIGRTLLSVCTRGDFSWNGVGTESHRHTFV